METTTETSPAEAPSGTIFAYCPANGGDEHLCTIEGEDEDGILVRFLSPWTTDGGVTITGFYGGVPEHRLSTPTDGAVYGEMLKAERDIEGVRDQMERLREDLDESKALLLKLTRLWEQD